MSLNDIILYLGAFVAIWLGAGLVIKSIDGVAHKLHLHPFILSFFLLGLLTSIPEMAVGLSALAQSDPQIYVGNLIGGIPVLFLLVIPALGLLGGGITLTHDLNKNQLLTTLTVIALPAIFTIDRNLTPTEGVFLVCAYLFTFVQINKGQAVNLKSTRKELTRRKYTLTDMLKLFAGAGVVFVSSQIIVDKTLLLSTTFAISPFVVSLIVISLGTNLPELSLALHAVVNRKKTIALGDYLGSAAANTLLIGLLTIIYQEEVVIINHLYVTFATIVLGISAFYIFSRSGQRLDRKEAAVLLMGYFLFVLLETVISRSPTP